jgi:hypothetical protein
MLKIYCVLPGKHPESPLHISFADKEDSCLNVYSRSRTRFSVFESMRPSLPFPIHHSERGVTFVRF